MKSLRKTPAVAGATDRVVAPLERAWTDVSMSKAEREREMRVNLEWAGVLAGAAAATSRANAGTGLEWPEHGFDMLRAAHASVVLADAPRALSGSTTRAMDSAETGYGLELVGAAFHDELWRRARKRDLLLERIAVTRVPSGNATIAVAGDLPELQLVSENTGPTDAVYATSKWASGSKNASAAKLTLQNMWSGELNEDSIVGGVPAFRSVAEEGFRLYLGSLVYNGDTTNAATGNINSDDADPADTKHFLAWDGIRHLPLVTATGQSKNMAAALDIDEIDVARDKLADTEDSVVDLGGIDWSGDPSNLLIVCDRRTHRTLRAQPGYTSPDRMVGGGRAGDVGRLNGIGVFSPSYATRTTASGFLSATPASNVKGQLTILNVHAWRLMQTGGIRIYAQRKQGTDQILLELYARMNLLRLNDKAAAMILNITV